jgi:pseudouridine synthase
MDQDSRLNKFLASCGIGSRRDCDELVENGRVEINGQVCDNPGVKVKPTDFVKIDGKKVVAKRSTTILLNKPKGYVCSKEDELGRMTIYALLPANLHHLHHVGRLDMDSEGLIILTNDGDLTQILMHPTNKVEKEYLVTSDQAFENKHLDLLLSGIYTKEGKMQAKSVRRLSARRLEIVLDSGAKRQIRVMLKSLSYRVTKLVRVRIGMLWGGDLDVGRYRILSSEEVTMSQNNPPISKKSKVKTIDSLKLEKATQDVKPLITTVREKPNNKMPLAKRSKPGSSKSNNKKPIVRKSSIGSKSRQKSR